LKTRPTHNTLKNNRNYNDMSHRTINRALLNITIGDAGGRPGDQNGAQAGNDAVIVGIRAALPAGSNGAQNEKARLLAGAPFQIAMKSRRITSP
jgi:hypothetical protein